MVEKRGAKAKKTISQSIKNLKSVKWAASVKKSGSFCIQPKRFLPFFAADLVAVSLAFLLVSSNALSLEMFSYGYSPSELSYIFAGAGALLIVWILATLWISGAVIYQSWKPDGFRQSWTVAYRRYPSLLAVAIIAGLISFLVSSVPYIGILLSLIASMAFLLVNQFVIVRGSGFYLALVNSVKTFRYRVSPVILAWLLGGAFSSIIIIIFALPLVSTFVYFIEQYGMEEALVYMLVYVDRTWLYLEGGIFLLGVAISRAFGLKFLTEIYLQLNKKKFLIF